MARSPDRVRTFVWVDAWQQQCCGEEFGVGSSVSWTVIQGENSRDWVTTLLGPDWGDSVPYLEDHHGGDGPRHELRGLVRSIQVVTCDRQREPPPGSAPNGRRAWVPVPGSGRLRAVEVADPWEPEPRTEDPRRSFDGWIVEIEADQLP